MKHLLSAVTIDAFKAVFKMRQAHYHKHTQPLLHELQQDWRTLMLKQLSKRRPRDCGGVGVFDADEHRVFLNSLPPERRYVAAQMFYGATRAAARIGKQTHTDTELAGEISGWCGRCEFETEAHRYSD